MVCLWTLKGERTLTIRKLWGRQRSKSAFKDSRLPVLGWTIWLNYLWLCWNIRNKWETQSIQSQKTIYNPCNWFGWLSCSFVCLLFVYIKRKKVPPTKYRPLFRRTNSIKKREEKLNNLLSNRSDFGPLLHVCFVCLKNIYLWGQYN
jgi:hypothetical protein